MTAITLTVLNNNKQQVRIRLAENGDTRSRTRNRTAPHQNSLFRSYASAKKRRSQPQVKDSHGRTIARMTCNGANPHAEQVNRGMACVYRKYAKDNRLYVLQHEAKAAKRGLWSDPSPLPPWACFIDGYSPRERMSERFGASRKRRICRFNDSGSFYTSGGSRSSPDITTISIGARWLRLDALAIASCSCKS